MHPRRTRGLASRRFWTTSLSLVSVSVTTHGTYPDSWDEPRTQLPLETLLVVEAAIVLHLVPGNLGELQIAVGAVSGLVVAVHYRLTLGSQRHFLRRRRTRNLAIRDLPSLKSKTTNHYPNLRTTSLTQKDAILCIVKIHEAVCRHEPLRALTTRTVVILHSRPPRSGLTTPSSQWGTQAATVSVLK